MSEQDIRAAFLQQVKACESLGSPFTARLCRLMGERLAPGTAVADHILTWPGDPSALADSVPLRLAGALHGLLISKKSAVLQAVYPPQDQSVDDEMLWEALCTVLETESAFILNRLKSPPQTNEVRRSGATLPLFLEVSRRTGLPLSLTEIGASAGLNLFLDDYHITLGDQAWGDENSAVTLNPTWHGSPAPQAALDILARTGCDLKPIDPGSREDRERKLSYIWADQEDRLTRTRAAFDIAAASDIRVAEADALDWLRQETARTHDGAVHVIYSTIAWQYLPQEARAAGEEIIHEAGARATESAPLAWALMENDGVGPGAELSLTFWPGGERQQVGRADFHGRWVDWTGWQD
ncbi:DUF2332 family protein [Sneathiella marina]|uniref:DUF2332 family protein n=1 Tax=Sneathiella marina TaxID=2950108 RepID=A0ABY4W6N0_9PROT|nr:DUF2332 family protein [Sneathiella marina]USG62832.1 DUF2332 family protein [Sneathiella marina]